MTKIIGNIFGYSLFTYKNIIMIKYFLISPNNYSYFIINLNSFNLIIVSLS